jgi:hypothetical protein
MNQPRVVLVSAAVLVAVLGFTLVRSCGGEEPVAPAATTGTRDGERLPATIPEPPEPLQPTFEAREAESRPPRDADVAPVRPERDAVERSDPPLPRDTISSRRLAELREEMLPEPSEAEIEELRRQQMDSSADAYRRFEPVEDAPEPPQEVLDQMRREADSQEPGEEQLERLRRESLDSEPSAEDLERLRREAP